MSTNVKTPAETENTIYCSCCNEIVAVQDSVSMSEDYLCLNCAEDKTIICHGCGERIWRSDNSGTSATPLCGYCRDNDYIECEGCGILVDNDSACYIEHGDDTLYCNLCYQDNLEKPIHSYNYKPEPVFYGEGKMYMGVELEVDIGGKCDSNAERILEIFNYEDEYVYIKSDGSLDDGFEIVTHPTSPRFHKEKIPWENALNQLKSMGYQSHNCSTAGLHIHVNRDYFGNTEEEQDAGIANVLYLFERFWEEMLRFSRRTETQVKRWAARYGYKQSGREILETAKNRYSGRYTCINLMNYTTVEFRVFRGTLKYNTLLATLQFIEELCKVACYLPEYELKKLSWSSLMLRLSEEHTPELIQYLKERRLYVNEPVPINSEEEI